MNVFETLVANRETCPKLKVRKVYINEDPNIEEAIQCPKCWSQNRESTVRYIYVNLQEAIFKCESPCCMYPFRNFKFKNYTDQTVYHYKPAIDDTSLALPDFGPIFADTSSPKKVSNLTPYQTDVGSLDDFSLEFFSPEKINSNSISRVKTPDKKNESIFEGPTLNYQNLVTDFDTGFIDDILLDLGETSSAEKAILKSPVHTVPRKETTTTGRQLKRCLQIFQGSGTNSTKTDGVFKIPSLPGTEATVSPKVKLKKLSSHKRLKQSRRSAHESASKRDQIKPLQFIETLKKSGSPQLPGIKRNGNQKVERMLEFIERSMKNRKSKAETDMQMAESLDSFRPEPIAYRKRKDPRKLSLSAAVLHDTEFEYSTSDAEEKDESTTDSDLMETDVSDMSDQELDGSTSQLSFGEVRSRTEFSIVSDTDEPESPSQLLQLENSPARRLHSMDSISCLLE